MGDEIKNRDLFNEVINITAKLNRQLAYTARLELENKALNEKNKTLETRMKELESNIKEMREVIHDLQSDDE